MLLLLKVVSIVGVGESTYDGFRKWLDLEIKEEDFVVDTDATYKLTIKFTDFRELNDGSFHYAFGNPCIPELSKSGINDWFWRKRYNPEIECSEFNEDIIHQHILQTWIRWSMNIRPLN